MKDLVIGIPKHGEVNLMQCLKDAYSKLRSGDVRSVTEPFTKTRYFNTEFDRIRLARRIFYMENQLRDVQSRKL